ncbi:MAG: trigger factor [Candidatus Moranbacteria bacterium]|nr:trigger factor [Candidatus Moranbacteria bacterium]
MAATKKDEQAKKNQSEDKKARQKKEYKPEIKAEKVSDSKLKLNMAVKADKFEKFIESVARTLAKDINLDGFRKGKAPLEVVKKEAGEEKLLYEAAEEAVKKYYVDYIVENKIQAVGQPEVKFKKVAYGEDLEVELEVSVLPEVKLADNWKEEAGKINESHKGDKAEASEEEIQHEINTLANQRAKISTVDREARKGDQVQVDFQVFKDNVALEGGNAKDHQVVIGEGRFIPGFEEKLQGMKAGEEKDFDLQFPKEYRQENLAGQKATFKVKMKNVQQRDLPEINDEFASGIGKFNSLQELKDNIKNGLEEEKKKQNKQKHQMELIDKLVDTVEVEIPEVLVDKEIERMKSELDSELSRMGLDKASYLQQIGTTEEQLVKQWKDKDALRRVKAGLILRKLSKEQEIEPSKEEIKERANAVIQQYQMMQQQQGQNQEDLDVQKIYDNVKAEMANEKTLEYLMGI